jgi:RHS repeat-associated protein
VYASSYDSWGNVTSRTYSSTTATLTYDLLDHFVSWNAGTNNQDLYVYDASGTRVLRRTTNSSGTSMTVYAFGLEEHTYTASGSHTGDLYYYTLGGRLLGTLDSSANTVFDLTDALGSVMASFSNTANSAAIKGNQVFGPYGNFRDIQGSINTAKGFTGQYNDSLTGLDYYGSRYYDQVAGVFLSADTVQGNMQGMNPYAYVGGNPETRNDPTGGYFAPGGNGNGGPPPSCTQLGDCSNINGSNPFIADVFPHIVFPGVSSVPPASLIVPQPKVNLGSSTIDLFHTVSPRVERQEQVSTSVGILESIMPSTSQLGECLEFPDLGVSNVDLVVVQMVGEAGEEVISQVHMHRMQKGRYPGERMAT